MAEDRTFATGKNGRHPQASCRQTTVPYGVDAFVNDVQAACSQSTLDCSSSEADSQQLPPRDNSVLTSGEFRDPAITWLL